MRTTTVVIALSVLAIALMLGWDRFAEWRVTHSDSYQRDKSHCERIEIYFLDPEGARECWEDLERKYGVNR